jgi:hypothetical protein
MLCLMAIRVISICDGVVPISQRAGLPTVLSRGLGLVNTELKALGFDPSLLEPSRWVWEWNPDLDGAFADWLKGDRVSLFWPDDSGIAVVSSIGGTYISSGVRWDGFIGSVSIRRLVINIVRAIVRQLEGHSVLLVPDAGDKVADQVQDMFFDGIDFAELAATAKDSSVCRFIEFASPPR